MKKTELISHLSIKAKIGILLIGLCGIFFTAYLIFKFNSGEFDFKQKGRFSDTRFFVQVILIDVAGLLMLYFRAMSIKITEDKIIIKRFFILPSKEYLFSDIDKMYSTSFWFTTMGYDSYTIKFFNGNFIRLDSFFISNQKELVSRFKYIQNNF